MKKLMMSAIALVFVIGTALGQEKLNWVGMEEAQKLAKDEGKYMLVDLYTPWCGPCKMMERTTFNDPTLATFLSKEFVAVKFNAEGEDPVQFNGKTYQNPGYDPQRGNGRNSVHELTRFLGVGGYPTLAVMDSSGKVIQLLVGYRSAKDLQAQLSNLIKA